MSSQQVIPSQRLRMGRLLLLRDAVRVVQFRSSVQAHADKEVFCRQKAPPLVIQQCAVRLYSVQNAAIVRRMLALKRDNAAEIIHPQQRRLAAMPGKPNLRAGKCLDMLNDILFKKIGGHPRWFVLSIKAFRLQIIAIAAI